MRPTFRTLKIDDARALQALVAEQAESLETGLKVLDEGVLLGGGAVDLVALDAEGALVLIVIAFVADDAMLLRALEAYAWCLEYPDTIGRLYSAIGTAPATPPRVMFVGERLSDAFLRKVKHLRMPSIDCLEFRYLEVNGVAALSFNPVDSPRPADRTPPFAPSGAGAPPAPITRAASTASSPAPVVATHTEPQIVGPPPAPSRAEGGTPTVQPIASLAAAPVAVEPPTVGVEVADPAAPADPPIRATAPAEADRPRPAKTRPTELLEGLRIPETLSPQWRRILNRPPSAPDAAKIQVVRDYLQGEFPGCIVHDFYEHQRAAHVFQLQNSRGGLIHLAVVADDFFEAEAEGDIRHVLERNRLARALREAGRSDVLITGAGIRVTKG